MPLQAISDHITCKQNTAYHLTGDRTNLSLVRRCLQARRHINTWVDNFTKPTVLQRSVTLISTFLLNLQNVHLLWNIKYTATVNQTRVLRNTIMSPDEGGWSKKCNRQTLRVWHRKADTMMSKHYPFFTHTKNKNPQLTFLHPAVCRKWFST